MHFNDFELDLIDDLAWRKKELSDLMLIAKNSNEKEVILKSIILLIYAHWEGYIKRASKLYLNFVAKQNHNLDILTNNYVAISLKDIIKQCINVKDELTLENEITVINKFAKARKFKVNLSVDESKSNEIINTYSNLTPKVFRNILNTVGLDQKKVLKKYENYINEFLLNSRNSISHSGLNQKSSISKASALIMPELEKLRAVVFSIIENFQEELIEFAKNSYFMKEHAKQRTAFLQQKEHELTDTLDKVIKNYDQIISS